MKSVDDESNIFLNMSKINENFRMITKFYDELSYLESKTYNSDVGKENNALKNLNSSLDFQNSI